MEGRIVRPILESRLLRGNPLGDPTDRETPVYLPPSYDESSKRRYPLILAITGFTGTGRMLLNENFFDEDLGTRLDRLIASGEMGEAIVVMPDCMTRYGGSQYVDSGATGPYGTYLADEVVAWADKEFRTIPRREARGVFGKSSGGFGSIRMALDFPEVFSAFACHSGDLAFEYCYLPEFPKAVRYLDSHKLTPRQFLDTFMTVTDRSGGFMEVLNEFAMASCYSPDAQSELGFLLPFDPETGEIVPQVWARWLSHDPVRMIPERLERLRRMNLIYLDCGRKDEFSLDVGARIAAKRMRAAGLDVLHEEFDAGHMSIPFRYDRSLPLITKALAPPEG
ncbi:MAG: alpha/beta hydrolase [Actinomycetota bacterium]